MAGRGFPPPLDLCAKAWKAYAEASLLQGVFGWKVLSARHGVRERSSVGTAASRAWDRVDMTQATVAVVVNWGGGSEPVENNRQ